MKSVIVLGLGLFLMSSSFTSPIALASLNIAISTPADTGEVIASRINGDGRLWLMNLFEPAQTPIAINLDEDGKILRGSSAILSQDGSKIILKATADAKLPGDWIRSRTGTSMRAVFTFDRKLKNWTALNTKPKGTIGSTDYGPAYRVNFTGDIFLSQYNAVEYWGSTADERRGCEVHSGFQYVNCWVLFNYRNHTQKIIRPNQGYRQPFLISEDGRWVVFGSGGSCQTAYCFLIKNTETDQEFVIQTDYRYHSNPIFYHDPVLGEALITATPRWKEDTEFEVFSLDRGVQEDGYKWFPAMHGKTCEALVQASHDVLFVQNGIPFCYSSFMQLGKAENRQTSTNLVTGAATQDFDFSSDPHFWPQFGSHNDHGSNVVRIGYQYDEKFEVKSYFISKRGSGEWLDFTERLKNLP